MIVKKICNGPYFRGSSDFYSKHQAFYDNNDNIIEGLKIKGDPDILNTFRLPLEELSALRYNVDLSRIKSSNYFQVLHQNRLIAYSVDSGNFNEVARYTLNAIYYNNDKQIVCRLSGNDTKRINLIDTTRNIVYTDDLEGYYIVKIFNINDNRIRVVCIYTYDRSRILVKDYELTNSGYLMPFKVIKSEINSPELFILGHSFIGKNNYDSNTNTFKTYNFEKDTQYTVKILDSASDYYHLINCKQIDSTSYKILTKSNDNIQYTLAKCTIDHANSTIYLSSLQKERLRSIIGDIYQDDYGIYNLYQGNFEVIEVDQDGNTLNYKGVISKPNTQTAFYDFVNKKQIFYYQNVNKQNNLEGGDQFPFNCAQNEESYTLSNEEYYVDLIFTPDQIYYSGSNVPGIIKVAVKDINNNFVSKLVKITINNKNVAIFENNQYTITVFTSNSGYIDVNITYTDAGILDLTAEIIDTINQ